MLAPLRNGAGMTARSALRRGAQPSAVLGRRSIVLKKERWTDEQIQNAKDSGLVPDAQGNPTMDLAKILPHIEARWTQMPNEEQYGLYQHLDALQRKDWKELTLDEKKASYYVAFGPHGPRKPLTQPGQAVKTAVGVTAILAATFVLFYGVRQLASPPPKTMTKEYQEQMNERAIEEKRNPITGISSEGYKGKGHVQKLHS